MMKIGYLPTLPNRTLEMAGHASLFTSLYVLPSYLSIVKPRQLLVPAFIVPSATNLR